MYRRATATCRTLPSDERSRETAAELRVVDGRSPVRARVLLVADLPDLVEAVEHVWRTRPLGRPISSSIHDFDLARFVLAGDEIVEVSAMGSVMIDKAVGELGDVDTAMVTMKASSGALIHINNSRRSVYGYDQRLEAFGSKGMARSENLRSTEQVPGRAEEGRLLRIPEPRRLNIGVKVGFQVMMALGARSCGLSRVAKDRRGRGIASAKPYATGERFATGGSSEIRLTPRLPQRGIIRFRMPDRDMLQPRVQARRRPR